MKKGENKMPFFKRVKKVVKGEVEVGHSSLRIAEFEHKPFRELHAEPPRHEAEGHEHGNYLKIGKPRVNIYEVRALSESISRHHDASSATTHEERQRLHEIAAQHERAAHYANEINRLRATIQGKKFWDSGMQPGFMKVHKGSSRQGLAKSLFGIKTTYRSIHAPAQKFEKVKVPILGSIPVLGWFFNKPAQGLLNLISYPLRKRTTVKDVIEQSLKENTKLYNEEMAKFNEMVEREPDFQGLLNRFNHDFETFVKGQRRKESAAKKAA